MKSDYTLIIPTYNRVSQLKRLLFYLQNENASFSILILDSSHSHYREQNQAILKTISLETIYIEYPENINPFDKFRDGISRVRTPFCQLCADDDLILVNGIEICVNYLKDNPDIKLAHGYYFMFFECKIQGGIDIPYTLYYASSYHDEQAIFRLRELFKNYQALTYGVYDTVTLNKIFDNIAPINSILGRELLGSALAVVYGKVTRLPIFTHGRNMESSLGYQYWHPLEWLIRSPADLFNEYKKYRQILIKEILGFNSKFTKLEIEHFIDLIHFFYLVRHTPEPSLDFLIENTLMGKSFDEIWQKNEVQIPLTQSKYLFEETISSNSIKNDISNWINKFYPTLNLEKKEIRMMSNIEQVKTSKRKYRFHEKFIYPDKTSGITINKFAIQNIANALDSY